MVERKFGKMFVFGIVVGFMKIFVRFVEVYYEKQTLWMRVLSGSNYYIFLTSIFTSRRNI